MTSHTIKQSIARVAAFYTEQPEEAVTTDTAAVAVVEGGLRCRAEGAHNAVLVTDMPKGIGGGRTAPTPGWFLRAALATCDATMIAMRAAERGVELTRLEVTVDSVSDSRGILDTGGDFPAGPLSMRVRVRIAADGVAPDELRGLVEWAESHSAVGDALRRAIPYDTLVEVG